jgi:hypothetical protein
VQRDEGNEDVTTTWALPPRAEIGAARATEIKTDNMKFPRARRVRCVEGSLASIGGSAGEDVARRRLIHAK